MTEDLDMQEALEEEVMRRRLQNAVCAECGCIGEHSSPLCPGFDDNEYLEEDE